ncbi:hypothetical protein L916_10948 [Plasmopara halstedii]|uniref:Uncharacterized protein n=1 Tax=Plasmopara halstedii TaxID=4781 RepID=A0A0P1A552_PLAHL|nr:hypothetical protein L916_10948 [Plasmopara halstedii]CEG35656.1 hypothetical protein L916_10948 [Plasmopara halstedii]|eukprot:XP_024572025.1 hypothetical protein L916_10948 [Plasmopara halstedii]
MTVAQLVHMLLCAMLSTRFVLADLEDLSKLRRLVTLSRHGSRAPNNIVRFICPRNKRNLDAYEVPLTQLTEIGMNQLLAVGEHIRRTYMVDELEHEEAFLSRSLNGVNHSHFETYFRADAATRCAQSATALGYGLYPDGTGPHGFPHQPVPITMQLVENEHAFAAPKGPCLSTLEADLAVYAQHRAPELFDHYRDVLEQVGKACGVFIEDIPYIPGGEDAVLGVKDLADMFVFDRDEGLPLLEGVTVEAREKLNQLAFTNLMERYFSSDRKVTYWVGGFSDLLLNTLHDGAVPTAPSVEDYRFFSFHGHRELLHGLGMMLGWEFHFEGLPTALNVSALHPGTTMFFELRARPPTNEEAREQPKASEIYFLRTYIWSPLTKREQIRLTKCSVADCPLNEFTRIITDHIAKTDPWETICNYKRPVVGQSQVALSQEPFVERFNGSSHLSSLVLIGVAIVVALALATFKSLP